MTWCAGCGVAVGECNRRRLQSLVDGGKAGRIRCCSQCECGTVTERPPRFYDGSERPCSGCGYPPGTCTDGCRREAITDRIGRFRSERFVVSSPFAAELAATGKRVGAVVVDPNGSAALVLVDDEGDE